MSYDSLLLFRKVSIRLFENPRETLSEISREMCVGKRTIQQAVRVSARKSFKRLREDVLLAEVKRLLIERPELAIKELSFEVGFTSATSFARAIRRICRLSPVELRSLVAGGYAIPQTAPRVPDISLGSQRGMASAHSTATA